MAAACNKPSTGVGPSIASSSPKSQGTWAAFPPEPANRQRALLEVVGYVQHQLRVVDEGDVGEEAGAAGLTVPIADGVEAHEAAVDCEQPHNRPRQPHDVQAYADVEGAAGDPGIDRQLDR